MKSALGNLQKSNKQRFFQVYFYSFVSGFKLLLINEIKYRMINRMISKVWQQLCIVCNSLSRPLSLSLSPTHCPFLSLQFCGFFHKENVVVTANVTIQSIRDFYALSRLQVDYEYTIYTIYIGKQAKMEAK